MPSVLVGECSPTLGRQGFRCMCPGDISMNPLDPLGIFDLINAYLLTLKYNESHFTILIMHLSLIPSLILYVIYLYLYLHVDLLQRQQMGLLQRLIAL